MSTCDLTHMSDIHVVPVNDIIEHLELRQCWCRPLVTEHEYGSAVVTHHAADAREYFEEGTGHERVF